ncbi:MAG: hypothetical protein R3B98_00055 [Hyphomonas sp.]
MLKLLNEADPDDQDSLDAHPIVRAHFARSQRTAPDAFQAAHGGSTGATRRHA